MPPRQEKCQLLVPMADMINHSVDANVGYEISSTRFELRAWQASAGGSPHHTVQVGRGLQLALCGPPLTAKPAGLTLCGGCSQYQRPISTRYWCEQA